jgi:hypothetical protein
MAAVNAFLRFAAKAALNWIGAGIGGEFCVEVLPAFANDLRQWWARSHLDDQQCKEVGEVARLTSEEVTCQRDQALSLEIEELPEEQLSKLTNENLKNVSLFVSVVSDSIRKSQRRLSDPTDRTLSRDLSFQQPESIIALLPKRLPRSKPGDRPFRMTRRAVVALLKARNYLARQNKNSEVLWLPLDWSKIDEPDFQGAVLLNPKRNLVVGVCPEEVIAFRQRVMKQVEGHWVRHEGVGGRSKDPHSVGVRFTRSDDKPGVVCKVKPGLVCAVTTEISIRGFGKNGLECYGKEEYEWGDIEGFLKEFKDFCSRSKALEKRI